MNSDRQQFETTTLKNGIRVFTHHTPVEFAQFRLLIPIGSAHSHAGNEGGAAGIAHLLEHMCFIRGEYFPESHSFTKYVAEKGGRINAWTSAFHTEFFLEAPRETFVTLAQAFMHQVYQPQFHPDDIETEIRVIKNERSQRKYYPGNDELSQYKYGPWLHTVQTTKEQVFGDDESLASITPALLTQFHQHYHSSDAIVVLGGDLAPDALLPTIEAITTQPTKVRPIMLEPRCANPTFHELPVSDMDHPTFVFGTTSTTYDLHTLWVHAFILDYLTDTETGALTTWLRNGAGESYSILPYNWFDSTQGGFTIDIPITTPDFITTLRTEFKDRIETALSDRDGVERFKATTLLRTCYAYETLHERLERASNMLSAGLTAVPTEVEYEAWVRGVDNNLLTTAFREVLNNPNTGTFVAVPT